MLSVPDFALKNCETKPGMETPGFEQPRTQAHFWHGEEPGYEARVRGYSITASWYMQSCTYSYTYATVHRWIKGAA